MSFAILLLLESSDAVIASGVVEQPTGFYDVFGVADIVNPIILAGSGVVDQPSGFYEVNGKGVLQKVVLVAGKARAMLSWRDNGGRAWLAVGTNTHLYSFMQGVLDDITPVGYITGPADASTAIGAYGQGLYGANAYGSGDPAQSTLIEAAVWHLDTFGQLLICCAPHDGNIYVYDLVAGAAVLISGATFPVANRGVFVTPERFVVALGADGDGRLIRWADRETYTVWQNLSTNTAGEWPLQSNGRIKAGRRGRGESLIWTDVDVHAMRYIGGTLVFSFERLGTSCGLVAPNALVMDDGRAFWMGDKSFHMYDGYVQDLPCEVNDYVFSDINLMQASKFWAMPISAFNEIWFFYVSGGSTEIDRYVIYNVEERHWVIGKLARLCGVDRGAFQNPFMADAAGFILEHEKGFDHAGLVPYLTSGPVEINGGQNVMSVMSLIPDEKSQGDVRAYFRTRFYPQGEETVYGPYVLNPRIPTDVRFEARQVEIQLEQAREGDWRLGNIRADVEQGGER